MMSSTGQESTARQGDIPKGAVVIVSLIDDGLEYLDGEDLVIGRHLIDDVTDVGLTMRLTRVYNEEGDGF